jgi:hypothetical protein
MAGLFDSILSRDDIQSLIVDHTRESEVLEYKTASSAFTDRDKQEIAKDVSAMANSLGGVIIYGIATDATDKTLPVSIVPIEQRNIETLDRVINAQIRPPVNGLRRKVIPVDNPEVLILEVPSSEDPPHQSLYDKKYYRRSGAECLPMEHDLVALKFGRKLAPVLDLMFQPLTNPTAFSGEPPWSNEARLRVLISNTGRRIGRHLKILFRFPSSSVVRIRDINHNLQSIDDLYPGQQARQFGDDNGVYHPGMNTSVIGMGLTFAEPFMKQNVQDTLIDWTLFADEMSPKQGEVFMNDLGWLPKQEGG